MPSKKKARSAPKKRARSPSPADSESPASESRPEQGSKRRDQPTVSTLTDAITQMAAAVSALAQRTAEQTISSPASPAHEAENRDEPDLSSLMLLPAAQLIQSPPAVHRVLSAIRDPMERAAKVDAILTAIETNFLTLRGEGNDARGRRIEEEVFQPIRELLAITLGPPDALVARMTEYLVRRAQWAHVLATRGHEVAATLLREAKVGTARRDPILAKALAAPPLSTSAAHSESKNVRAAGRQLQGRGTTGPRSGIGLASNGNGSAKGPGKPSSRPSMSPTKSEKRQGSSA